MIKLTTNSTRNTKNKILAPSIAGPTIVVNPSIAAIRATTRKMTAYRSMTIPKLKCLQSHDQVLIAASEL